MILEGILLHGVGEHAAPLEVVGGGKLKGDGNDGADAGKKSRKSTLRYQGTFLHLPQSHG
jgi:hypothetical protein